MSCQSGKVGRGRDRQTDRQAGRQTDKQRLDDRLTDWLNFITEGLRKDKGLALNAFRTTCPCYREREGRRGEREGASARARERERERERENKRTNEFFVNEGNGISTFLHPAQWGGGGGGGEREREREQTKERILY